MNVTRAWKDPEYRASLTGRERSVLPTSPVGVVELSDDEILAVDGGSHPTTTIPATIVTVELNCYSGGATFCNGTCAFGGTQGCCPQ